MKCWLILLFFYLLLEVSLGKNFVTFSDVNTYNTFVNIDREEDYRIHSCSSLTDVMLANCNALKSNGFCSSHRREMLQICPLTCHFCKDSPYSGSRGYFEPMCESSTFGCCQDGKTFAFGPKGVGCPENCYDKKYCKFYKSLGYCNNHYQHKMARMCPITCGLCKPSQKQDCFDDWDEGVCKHFAQRSLCRNAKYKHYMEKYCRRKCGYCFAATATPSLNTIHSRCLSDMSEECCWDMTTRKSDGCPVCADRRSKEYCQQHKNQCNDIYGLRSVFTRLFCPQTCGLCYPEYTCKDSVVFAPFCMFWRSQDYCLINERVMSTICKETCGACGP